jgi:beta-mannosidase
MLKQSLTGPWQFRQASTETWLPATVPGAVHTDLMAAGCIPDPFAGENELQVKWVADQDWEYWREFDADAGLLAEERIYLVCDGLDSLAEVTLNGQSLGQTNNMFRHYRWEIKKLLQTGKNTLSILFSSPVAYIKARQAARPLPTLMNGGMAYLRKVQSHFGWDWGPSLPTCGIWGEIYLEGCSIARLEDVHVRQKHFNGMVCLTIAAAFEQWAAGDLNLGITVISPNGPVSQAVQALKHSQDKFDVMIQNPQLWWPNGLGPQPLYQVEVSLLSGAHPEVAGEMQLLDRRSYQIGLRTLELRHDPDQWGQTFTFVINGLPIFAKGANWVPADSFMNRFSDAQLEHLIDSAAAANMNMLRVWGGGYYETERFYDLCDRYGILVWQDFLFACAPYPLDDAVFLENVRNEVVENVRRLRHRACLALWCGNNEVEIMWRLWKRRKNASLTAAYEQFFHHLLQAWVHSEDPDHACWPSSPSSGDFLQNPNGDGRGDTHLWQVWHGLQPFTFFRTKYTRFCSEFGLEALPDMQTIAGFAQPEEYDLKSSVFLHHQRSAGGNDKMLFYLTNRFRLPAAFADLVYLTQIDQAEAIRTGVEHWRRNRPRCSGALYWQLNDCWPVTSWASIDYAGRWKALHYAARRFFAPVALSLEDAGSYIGLYLANDTPQGWQGEVRWSLETLHGEKIESGQEAVNAAPLLASPLRKFDFTAQLNQHGARNLVFVAELWQASQRLACQVALFTPEKNMQLPDPGLTYKVRDVSKDLIIDITATRALARFVRLSFSGDTKGTIFSDNFFDLPAGRTQRITCSLPAGWTLEQARQNLTVHSLADVKPAGTAIADCFQHVLIGMKPGNLVRQVFVRFM